MVACIYEERALKPTVDFSTLSWIRRNQYLSSETHSVTDISAPPERSCCTMLCADIHTTLSHRFPFNPANIGIIRQISKLLFAYNTEGSINPYVQKNKKCNKFLISCKSSYICSTRIRHASRKAAHQGGTFIFTLSGCWRLLGRRGRCARCGSGRSGSFLPRNGRCRLPFS